MDFYENSCVLCKERVGYWLPTRIVASEGVGMHRKDQLENCYKSNELLIRRIRCRSDHCCKLRTEDREKVVCIYPDLEGTGPQMRLEMRIEWQSVMSRMCHSDIASDQSQDWAVGSPFLSGIDVQMSW